MANVIIIKTLEELQRFINEKGIMEIVTRDTNKKFKVFYKVAIDKLSQGKAEAKADAVISLLKKNNQIGEKSLKMLGGITKLNTLNLVLSGLNLCATCAGFAVMYGKLDDISSKIAEVVQVVKEVEGIHTEYEFRKVLSKHSDMLDCRRKKSYYSEEQMRELVDDEYNTLVLLMQVFSSSVSSNRDSLLFSILSLASMLAVSIKYFDELYYFNNRDTVGADECKHTSHERWMSVYTDLQSLQFVAQVQDFGFFEKGLSTVENDWFYMGFQDQIKSLVQEINDYEELFRKIDDPEVLKVYSERAKEAVISELEDIIRTAGASVEEYQDAVKAAVA